MNPIFANALSFAFDKSTTEGKITIGMLVIVSFISWSVIINKGWQLWQAKRKTKAFFAAFRLTRDPLELLRSKKEFDGSPAYELYRAGVEELEYQLKASPIVVNSKTKISNGALDSISIASERALSTESLSLEKGMIILTTAVAGGPFIGLLGTVWGVMETFSGIAVAKSASLTAMAPGVAGALIATVVGLFVAIPAMFAYNLMITTIRSMTQELDNFNAELTTSIEHGYVDNRALADEIAEAIRNLGLDKSAPQATRKETPNLKPAVA